MAQVPFPLTAELKLEYKGKTYIIDSTYLKNQIYELIRKLYEEKVAGLNLGDVFRIYGSSIQIETDSNQAIQKTTDNELGLRLYGVGLDQSSDGLKVGQSAHITDAETSYDLTGGTDNANVTKIEGYLTDLGEKLNEILDLLEERSVMAAS